MSWQLAGPRHRAASAHEAAAGPKQAPRTLVLPTHTRMDQGGTLQGPHEEAAGQRPASRIRRQPQQALLHAGPTPTQTRGACKEATCSAPRRWLARARLELQQEAGGCALAAVPRRMSRRRPRELRVWRPLDLREEESGGSG